MLLTAMPPIGQERGQNKDTFLLLNSIRKSPKSGLVDSILRDLHFANLPVHIHNTHFPTSQSLGLVSNKGALQSTVQPQSLKPHGSLSLVASLSSGSPKLAPTNKSILPWWWTRHALPWGCPWWFHASLVLAPPRHPTPLAPASKEG